MIGPSGLVNDGLTAKGRSNGGTTWTYNQGVILGGLAALFEITGDRAYLQQGESIADAALSALLPPVLAEFGREPRMPLAILLDRRLFASAAPRGKLRMSCNVGGAADFVLMPSDEHAIPSHDQIRLDVIGTLLDGQPIGLDGVFRTLAAGTAVSNNKNIRQGTPA